MLAGTMKGRWWSYWETTLNITGAEICSTVSAPVEVSGGDWVVSGVSITGWEVGRVVSPESAIDGDVVDVIDDVVDDMVDGDVVDDVVNVDVDEVADVCSPTGDSVVTLSFPLAKNFVGISNIFDCCLLLLFLSLLNPFRAERMSARPRLFSETKPSPSLYL